ncbi:MAG TPA: F0F1 ATP synthase subunit delta [Acidiferrobacteraceae bacterium]|nr:F0F1 ATP synthase subunit delta [Acidiferrobacteraceae bacterium]
MSEITTLARPYAQAIFKLAQEQADMAAWSDMLELLSQVSRDPTMGALIHSPRIDRDQLAGLFVEVCGQGINEQGANLVKLMIQNGRLGLLETVAQIYESLRADAEGKVDAEVLSAQAIDGAQQQRIATALKARLGRDVTLTCTINPELLGGAIIRAGDMVIDGSVRGRLQKLAGALN